MKLRTRNFNQPALNSNLWNSFFADDFLSKPLAKRDNTCGNVWNKAMPAVNIKENEHQYSIEVAAPGFVKSDFAIELDKGLLSISAKKVEQKEEEIQGYTHQEFVSSEFKRSFTLPEGTVNVEKIEASYEAGILMVSIPKKEKEETKISIEIL